MKGKTLANVIVTHCMTLLFLTTPLFAASLCHQTIELVGMTSEDTASLLFYEYVRGECEVYNVYQLLISKDSVLEIKGRQYDNLTFPMWTDSSFKGKKLEPAERLLEQDGRFAVSYYRQFFLASPVFETTSNKAIVDSVSNYYKRIPKTVDEPAFDREAKLLYSKPGGLYINYKIKDAYYYPHSKLLFILTHQPRVRSGDDTMHGVLIYRLK